ncbi:hypothetical protein [Sinomonas sp. G460-2]|uniref:hypothetical protein n=1 Tax=Sinomonas sp. G460-2 TaxID=3393464 RepID=UPI0039EE0E0C
MDFESRFGPSYADQVLREMSIAANGIARLVSEGNEVPQTLVQHWRWCHDEWTKLLRAGEN